jgi:hypothetical protein
MTRGRKIGLRVLSGAVVSLLLLLSGAGAAYACNEPRIIVNPGAAEAGDRVHFTIDNTQPGAEYKVWVDGKEIAEGVDTTEKSGVEGEFRMPDLGQKAQRIEVASIVEHRSTAHGDTVYDPDSVFMDYRVPASTPPKNAGDKPPPPSKTDRRPGDEGTRDRSRERPSRETDDRPGAGGREKPERFSPVLTTLVRRQAERDRSGGAAPAVPSGRAGAGDPTSGGESPSGESTSLGAETRANGEQSLGSGTRTSAREDTGAARAPGRPALARPHEAPITDIGAAGPAYATVAAPSAVILGLTLLALVVCLMIAVVAVRRRRGGPSDAGEAASTPPWVPPVVDAEVRARDLLIEAELQEMIAEHRAHELVSRARLDPSPARAGEDVLASADSPADGSLAGVG